MNGSRAVQISRLMEKGLRHYGEGLVEQAAACWNEVLELDPDHQEARGYLRNAGLDGGDVKAAETSGNGEASLLADALELFRTGEASEALVLLETLARENPRRMEIQGYFELVRSHLFTHYRERMADGTGVLRVRIRPEQILKFNLPANAGFVLATVDGSTSVNEIVALSGMDPFEAMRTMNSLLDAGIVEVNP
jgi:tetratricopeptide (TPR) repeat protein